MRKLKTAALGICLFIAAATAQAAKVSNNDNTANPVYAVNTYIDAMSHGKTAGLDQVIDKTAKFSYLRGTDIVSYGKAEAMNYINDNKDIEQGCTVTTSIVNSNADMELVKVDMHYKNFVRTNYVTLTNNGTSWKITNVYSVFK